MATKEFILQGITSRTHGDAVRELFDVPSIARVILSVAYIADDGVQQIEDRLMAHSNKLVVFAGIENDITSHQALLRLYNIPGCTLYTVDTGSQAVTFHPKLYLTVGNTHARLVLGSANLTLGGLNNNIEAGMLFEFDLANATDKATLDDIEAKLSDILPNHPSDVSRVNGVEELDAMLAAGRIVDEMAVRPPRLPRPASGSRTGPAVPPIQLKVKPMARAQRRPATPKAAMAVVAGTPASTQARSQVSKSGFWKMLSNNDVSKKGSPGQIIIPINYEPLMPSMVLEKEADTGGKGRQWGAHFTVFFRDGTFTATATDARFVKYEPKVNAPRPNTECRFTFRNNEIFHRLEAGDLLTFRVTSANPWNVEVERIVPSDPRYGMLKTDKNKWGEL